MATAAVFGCTGAVGKNILSTLLANDAFTSVKTISRRLPDTHAPKLDAIKESDSSKWGSMIAELDPKPSIVFNAVGTTRAAAGGVANQWKIDHDLCVDIAKAAKAAGVKTFVFVSSAGIRGTLTSTIAYSKMKIGVEDTIKELGFEQAIIMRPGMILGARDVPKAALAVGLISCLGKVSLGLQDALGQDQKVIARAAVVATQLALEGKAPSKYWTVETTEILKLGRDEWKE